MRRFDAMRGFTARIRGGGTTRDASNRIVDVFLSPINCRPIHHGHDPSDGAPAARDDERFASLHVIE
jgi:hypothetical protein